MRAEVSVPLQQPDDVVTGGIENRDVVYQQLQDAHPDVGTPKSEYPGYHAMALSPLVGRADQEFSDSLPATVDPSRVALAGLHAWTEDDIPHVNQWGITSFTPEQLSEWVWVLNRMVWQLPKYSSC